MQPCSAETPGASAGGAVEGATAVDWGAVVAVVVVVGGMVVVVVVGGTVVVVVVVVGVCEPSGMVVGTVVVVVVVGGTVVVVVVGGTVVVGAADGTVVGVLVVAVDPDAVGRRWRDGHGGARAGVLEGRDVRDELGQGVVLGRLVGRERDGGLGDGFGRVAAVLLGALERVGSGFVAGDEVGCCDAEILLDHHAVGVLRGARRERLVRPLLTSGAPEYKPLLTYSLMANPLRARDAAPNWSFALETWDSDAARASSRDANVD